MPTPYRDMDSLDLWLLKEALAQAERGVSVEDELIPPQVAQLGRSYVCLYASAIFIGEVANGGLSQFFENTSGALAPIVRDALREMELSGYADILAQIIDCFGDDYPHFQHIRSDRIDADPPLQEMLDRGSDAVDVWSDEFTSARKKFAEKCALIA